MPRLDPGSAGRPTWDVVVAGAGPAGRAAATAAALAGARAMLIDTASGPGGALAAMGLRLADNADWVEAGVWHSYQTTLIELQAGLELRMLGPGGIWRTSARALVLATGGREQTRGNL